MPVFACVCECVYINVRVCMCACVCACVLTPNIICAHVLTYWCIFIAAFLVPYTIMMVFLGTPIFFLELALGQFTSSGPLTCWQFAPLFQGMYVVSNVFSLQVGVTLLIQISYQCLHSKMLQIISK